MGEVDKEPNQDVTRRIWEENLNNLNLYHGTSVSIVQKIESDGLSPTSKPYSEEDKVFVENEALRLNTGDYGGYAKGKEGVFYVTSSQKAACDYAIDGPEMIRLYLLPMVTDVINKMETGNTDQLQNNADINKVKEIRKKLLSDILNHRPALIRIKRESDVFRKHIKDNLEEGWEGILDNYDVFKTIVDSVKKEVNIDGIEMTDEIVAKLIVDEVKERLLNKPVGTKIEPTDLEYMTGSEFDELNQTTKQVAEVRNYCLEDDEAQPSELIRLLERIVLYDAGTSVEVERLCEYYGIDKQRADWYFQKAVVLRQTKKEKEGEFRNGE